MIEIQPGRAYRLKNGMVVKALYRDRLTGLWVCDNGAVMRASDVDYQLPDPITDPDGYEITRPDIPKLVQKRTFYVTADVVIEVLAASEEEARKLAVSRLDASDQILINHVCED